MWENWLTNSLFYYASGEVKNYNKKKGLIQIDDKLKVRKINLFIDIMAGLYKQSLLLGKWGNCFKELSHKKMNFMDQVIFSQNKVFSIFGVEDGFSEVSRIVDLFVMGHKYFLYKYFGNDDQWDNEILCNAILRYFPFKFNDNQCDNSKFKLMFIYLNREVNDKFHNEIKNNKIPEEDKFIDFITNITSDFRRKLNIEGIVLFVTYMNLWRQYFLAKKETQIENNHNYLEYNDSLNNNYDDQTYVIDSIPYYQTYDFEKEENNEEDNKISFEVKDKESFWRKISSLLTPLENKIIKMKFIECLSFEKIAESLCIDKETCECCYQLGLNKIRDWFLTSDVSYYVKKC